MIAASVWIAPEILKSVSESIARSIAETTPTDSDCFSPNGEPMAATGRADLHGVALGDRQRAQREALGVDLEQRDVGVRVVADDLRLDLVAVGELDVDLVGAADLRRPRRS